MKNFENQKYLSLLASKFAIMNQNLRWKFYEDTEIFKLFYSFISPHTHSVALGKMKEAFLSFRVSAIHRNKISGTQ